MKRNIFLAYLLGLVGFCFSSCEYIKESEDKAEDRITVYNDDHKNIVFSPDVSSLEIYIISNVSWTSSSNADWCHTEPSSGEAGNCTIKIKADMNTGAAQRNADIRFSAGSAEVVISVMQSGVQTRSFTITHKAENFGIPVFYGVYGGTVDWGDNVVEDLMSANEHKYNKSGEKNVTFDLLYEENTMQIEVHGIKDVCRIDISNLRK